MSALSDKSLLELFAKSPVAQAEVARVEADLADKRRAIIEAASEAEAAARARAAKAGESVLALRTKVDECLAALWAAQSELHAVESEAGIAQAAAERARNKALWDLLPYGQQLLHETMGEVRYALNQSRSMVDVTIWRDRAGNVHEHDMRPEHRARWKRMEVLLAELAAMQLDPSVTPAEIRDRCAEARKETEAEIAIKTGDRVFPRRRTH